MKKVLVVMLLLILLVVGWGAGLSVGKGADMEAAKQPYIELAIEQESLEAYGVAIKSRERLVELEPSADNYLQLAATYEDAGRVTKYKETLTDMMAMFPKDERAYELLAQYYSTNGAPEDCVTVIRNAANKGIRNSVLDNLYYSNAFAFIKLGAGYEEAYRYYGGTALIKMNEKYFFVDDELEVLSKGYAEAHSMLDNVAGVKTEDGECYYVNSYDLKYMDSRLDYDSIDSFSENLSLVQIDGKYRYLSNKNKLVLGEYDQATLFANGVAAVKVEDKWSIINMSGEKVNGKKYVDVIIDEDNICSNQGRIFVKEDKDEGYYMIDVAGNRIGKDEYEDARPFFNAGYAAVKMKAETEDKDQKEEEIAKWGFVRTDGSVLIAPEYEDARSFGSTAAAVKVDGQWGFVTTGNRMVIEPQFEDAKNFSASGIAPVKTDGRWGYIQLLVSQEG